MKAPRVSYAVMAHPDRDRPSQALSWLLGAVLVVDTDGAGENATGDLAWEAARLRPGPAPDWCVVAQDDALPVAQIHSAAPAALAHAPSPVVSFYLGTSYPEHTVAAARVAMLKADEADAAWILSRRLHWGVAVAIRTELVGDMLRTVRRSRRPYDERISRWAEAAGHKIGYTWPSLVDHADGESLVRNRRRVKPRIAYRTGTAASWETSAVRM